MKLWLRKLLLSACLVLGAATLVGEEASELLNVSTANNRQSFWRGEYLTLCLSMPLAEPAPVNVELRREDPTKPGRRLFYHRMPVSDGLGRLNLRIDTQHLGGGTYWLLVTVQQQQRFFRFEVTETLAKSPGMLIDDTGSPELTSTAELAGLTAMIHFMSSDATYQTYRQDDASLAAQFDRLAKLQMLHWIQDATRPMSFSPPHSSANTDGEYLRRMLLMTEVLRRYPAHAGQLFDYDPTGFLGKHAHLVSYWRWGDLREDLAHYMLGQEQAMREDFRRRTGLEPLTDAEAMRLAAAVGSPEGLGYVDMPTRKWAQLIAENSPEMPPRELRELKARAHAWYGYLMNLNRRRYEAYIEQLRDLDPSLVHSTANTMGHNVERLGHYYATSYEPLDFRFVAIWNDQGGAPEYVYETAFAAELLNENRQPERPLWIDTVFGLKSGNHFRNMLLLGARGAQGSGYSFEMGSSLSSKGRGDRMVASRSPHLQEVLLNGKFQQMFGGIYRYSSYRPRVGLLHSTTQTRVTPMIPSATDALYKASYLLAHAGFPPALVNEAAIAKGLDPKIETLIVLHQTERLAPEVEAALQRFHEAGGRVLADTHTTVEWHFLEHSSVLDLPFRDAGHPYNMQTAYNRQDASVSDLRLLARQRVPKLRHLLSPMLADRPLACDDADIAVSELEGGVASFVTVVNDQRLDLEELFAPEEQQSFEFGRLRVGHGEGVIGSWIGQEAVLELSPKLPASTVIYDLFRGERVTPEVADGRRVVRCSLWNQPGRLYGLYPAPVGRGDLRADRKLRCGEELTFHYQATTADGRDLQAVVPVEIKLLADDGSPRLHLYRATDGLGRLQERLPTNTLEERNLVLEIRQLLDGQGRSVTVQLRGRLQIPVQPVGGVTVREPHKVHRFLADTGSFMIPVFGDGMRPYAQHLMVTLRDQGKPSQLWAPEVVDYFLGYRVPEEMAADKARVDAGKAIGKVVFQNGQTHVNGNIYSSALGGYRCGRPLVLLGWPGQNPVLDAIMASGVPWDDATVHQPGGGLVQRVKWMLSQDHDVLIIYGADEKGLAAALARTLDLPAADPVAKRVQALRTKMLRQRGLPRTYLPPVQQTRLSGYGAIGLDAQTGGERFTFAPVKRVHTPAEGLVFELARYGQSLAWLAPDGRLVPSPAVKGRRGAVVGQRTLVTPFNHLTMAWALEGRPLWRAYGDFKGFVPGSDRAVLESDGQLFEISPVGEVKPFTGPAPAPEARDSAFAVEVRTAKQGHRQQIEEIVVTRQADGHRVRNLELTASRTKADWRIHETLLESRDAKTLAVLRREVGRNRLQVWKEGWEQPHYLGNLPCTFLSDAAVSLDGNEFLLAADNGRYGLLDPRGQVLIEGQVGPFPGIQQVYPDNYVVFGGDGRAAYLVREGDGFVTQYVDLAGLDWPALEQTAEELRRAPLLSLHQPATANGQIPLDRFFWYVDTGDGLGQVNWSPKQNLDFRWLDAARTPVHFPGAKEYTVTIVAAAKYFDQMPMVQPSWGELPAMMHEAVSGRRPDPRFVVTIGGQSVELSPAGGKLKPFQTPEVKEGWATLKPQDNEFTTFQGKVTIPAGTHTVTIRAEGMQDCFMRSLTIR